jgi:hypothetical protein
MPPLHAVPPHRSASVFMKLPSTPRGLAAPPLAAAPWGPGERVRAEKVSGASEGHAVIWHAVMPAHYCHKQASHAIPARPSAPTLPLATSSSSSLQSPSSSSSSMRLAPAAAARPAPPLAAGAAE